jgi:cobalt-precorrin-5B (C1)-methyltransferase
MMVAAIRHLRTGFTTGACAAAATKAALHLLLGGNPLERVALRLPKGDEVSLPVDYCSRFAGSVTCGVKKDAGDDPDITNGMMIYSRVRLEPGLQSGEVLFERGEGVGVVTLAGLGIPIGEPAINPVPRAMIQRVASELLLKAGKQGGIAVSISVPGGEKIALKTLNAKLGVLGGLSILGTSGIVVPYSKEAYLESIHQSIRVALDNGCSELVINSGSKSEGFLKALVPSLPDFAFIHYGNWIGETLSMIAVEERCKKVTIGVMLAKATKLAAGNLDTSSRTVGVDPAFLACLALELGYPEALAEQIAALTTIRSLEALLPFRAEEPLYQHLASRCHKICSTLTSGIDTNFVLMNMEGRTLVCRNSTDNCFTV